MTDAVTALQQAIAMERAADSLSKLSDNFYGDLAETTAALPQHERDRLGVLLYELLRRRHTKITLAASAMKRDGRLTALLTPEEHAYYDAVWDATVALFRLSRTKFGEGRAY